MNEIGPYTKILHGPRKEMGLSTNEYCLCDLIHRLCRNGDGWAYASRAYYADFLGISKRSIITMIQRLSDSGFVIKEDGKSRAKTTKKWIVKDERAGEESSPKQVKGKKEPVKKVHPIGEESSPDAVKKVHPIGEESSPDAVKKVHPIGEESSPNIKRDLKLYTKIRFKGEDIDAPKNLQTEAFHAAFCELLKSKKWKNKSVGAILLSLKKLSEYDVGFAISLVERATMGDYQGVVFQDTDQQYKKWKQPNGSGPAATTNGRATINRLGADQDAYNEKQAF